MHRNALNLCLSLLLLAPAACELSDESIDSATGEIRFGTADTNGTYSDVVRINLPNNAMCSGTIVSSTRVLTAAHCVDGLSASQVTQIQVVTDTGTLQVSGAEVHPHSDLASAALVVSNNVSAGAFMATTTDLAVLTLSSPVTIQPRGLSTGIYSNGQQLTAVGYGRDENEIVGTRSFGLVALDGRFATRRNGQENYPGMNLVVEPIGGVLPCSGDSGGPLLDAQGQIIGVFSGFLHSGPGTCGSTLTGTYVSVRAFTNWILGVAPDHQNPEMALDVTGDAHLSPMDVLTVINTLNSPAGARQLTGQATSPPYYDVNGDGWVTPSDVLTVINSLNANDQP